MKAQEIVAALQSGYVSVKVRFLQYAGKDTAPEWGEKVYTYKALASWNIQPDDRVIVNSPKQNLVVVKVDSVSSDPDLNFAEVGNFKWIVQRVDTSQYDAITQQETELTQKVQALLRKQAQEKFLNDFSSALDGNPQKDAIIEELRNQADMSSIKLLT
jgi:uncharacterized caspase-like protein